MTISYTTLLERLAVEATTKIVYVIIDGIGGLAMEGKRALSSRSPGLRILIALRRGLYAVLWIL